MNEKRYYYWIGHNTLHRIIEFNFTIKAIEPLRIGSGKKTVLESPIDLPIIRINVGGEEKPYIPGSSLKGLFRSYMDVFIRSSGGYTCNLVGGNTCMRQIKEDVENYIANGNYDEAARKLWEGLCLSCKVFGSGGYRSKITFMDSYPVGDVRLGVKTGIMIDRRTGTVAGRALYQVEYVEPGAEFKSGFKVYDVPNYVLAILGLTLYDLRNGLLRIGGFKTRGFGRVDIKDLRIIFDIRTVIGGRREDNKIILNPMDHLDEEVVVNTVDGVSVSGDNAWEFLKKLIEKFIQDKEKLEKIIGEHNPRWISRIE